MIGKALLRQSDISVPFESIHLGFWTFHSQLLIRANYFDIMIHHKRSLETNESEFKLHREYPIILRIRRYALSVIGNR